MNRSVFLKVPVSLVDFVHLFSPSFSATTVLSPHSSLHLRLLFMSRCMRSFPSLTPSLYPRSSSLLSCSRRHIKYHLRVPFSLFLSLTLHQRFVLRPFTRTPLCVFSSPFLLPCLFAHLRPSLAVTVPPSLPLRALLFSSRLRRVSFALRLQRFPPLNYARNYA